MHLNLDLWFADQKTKVMSLPWCTQISLATEVGLQVVVRSRTIAEQLCILCFHIMRQQLLPIIAQKMCMLVCNKLTRRQNWIDGSCSIKKPNQDQVRSNVRWRPDTIPQSHYDAQLGSEISSLPRLNMWTLKITTIHTWSHDKAMLIRLILRMRLARYVSALTVYPSLSPVQSNPNVSSRPSIISSDDLLQVSLMGFI